VLLNVELGPAGPPVIYPEILPARGRGRFAGVADSVAPLHMRSAEERVRNSAEWKIGAVRLDGDLPFSREVVWATSEQGGRSSGPPPIRAGEDYAARPMSLRPQARMAWPRSSRLGSVSLVTRTGRTAMYCDHDAEASF
jgi:hypothetical protein